jgi:hypothetical protein
MIGIVKISVDKGNCAGQSITPMPNFKGLVGLIMNTKLELRRINPYHKKLCEYIIAMWPVDAAFQPWDKYFPGECVIYRRCQGNYDCRNR